MEPHHPEINTLEGDGDQRAKRRPVALWLGGGLAVFLLVGGLLVVADKRNDSERATTHAAQVARDQAAQADRAAAAADKAKEEAAKKAAQDKRAAEKKVEDAKKKAAADKKATDKAAKKKAEADKKAAEASEAKRVAAEKANAEESARRAADEEARRRATEQAQVEVQSPTPPPAAPAGACGGQPSSAAERQFFDSINNTRVQHSKPPLIWCDPLADSARGWSAHMISTTKFAHVGDIGSAVSSVLPGATGMAENIGQGGNVSAVYGALLNSGPHLANIIGNYNYVGVGVQVDSKGTLWVTMRFGRV